jgi:GxxExxY protein
MLKHGELTDKILKACYTVYNALGSGFMEKVYENALRVELQRLGLQVQQQVPITVWYEGEQIGEYFADLVVEDAVILELKAIENLAAIHEVQLTNYLKATTYEVGLLVNFGPKIEIRRRVSENNPRQSA